MYNKFLLTIISCFVLQTAIGQSIKNSKTASFIPNEQATKLIKTQDGSFYLHTTPLVGKKQTTKLIHFKEKGEPSKVEVEHPKDFFFGSEIFSIDNKLYQVIYNKDKKTRSLKSKIIAIDKNGNSTVAKELGEHEYSSYDDAPTNRIYFSPDSSYIAIIDLVDINEKKLDYKLRATILNDQLEVVNKKNYTPKRSDSQRLTHLFTANINNEGNLYMIQKRYGEKYSETKKGPNGKVANFTLEVLTLGTSGELKTESLDTKDQFFLAPAVFFTSTGNPFIACDIKENSKGGAKTLGIRSYIYSTTANKFTAKEYLFDNALREKMAGTNKNMVSAGGDFYVIDAQAISSDNEISFLLENKYKFTTTQNAGRTVTYVDNYVSESAVILRATNEGEITKTTFIPKYHINQSGFSPSMLQKINGNEYLLYHDLEKNLENDTDSFDDYGGGLLIAMKASIMVVGHEDGGRLKRSQIKMKEIKYRAFLNNLYLRNGENIVIPIITSEKLLAPMEVSLGHVQLQNK